MSNKIEQEVNLYDKIIVKNYSDLSLAEQFEKGAVVKVDDELAIARQQLAIAVEALELYKNLRGDGTLTNYESIAEQALQQIKELEK